MNAPATKLQTAENDLKQLMADVSRAMGKAQEAVARIAPKVGAAQQRRAITVAWRSAKCEAAAAD
jgi:hypothetical protein